MKKRELNMFLIDNVIQITSLIPLFILMNRSNTTITTSMSPSQLIK